MGINYLTKTTPQYINSIMKQALYKGSKNPPVNTQILLQSKHGDWGIGEAFKGRRGIFFDFRNKGRILLGVDKSDFIAWSMFPI